MNSTLRVLTVCLGWNRTEVCVEVPCKVVRWGSGALWMQRTMTLEVPGAGCIRPQLNGKLIQLDGGIDSFRQLNFGVPDRSTWVGGQVAPSASERHFSNARAVGFRMDATLLIPDATWRTQGFEESLAFLRWMNPAYQDSRYRRRSAEFRDPVDRAYLRMLGIAV